MSADERLNRMARSAFLVGGMSAITLALTLGWQLAIASEFGASPQLDAFWVALAIPRAIVESFHYGLLTLLFVLIFHRQGDGATRDPWAVSAAVLNVTILATLVVVVALMVFSAPLVRLMAPGFAGETAMLASELLRGLAPMLVPTCVAAAIGGLAIARGHLVPFTMSRAVLPALQIAALVAFAATLGIRALVWASWAGALASVLVFLPWMRRVGFRLSLEAHFGHPEVRPLLTLQALLALCWMVINFNQIAARYFASLLGDGHVSALEYAWRFEIPIAQIVSLAVALPTFALLAQSAAQDRRGHFREALSTSARLLLFAVVPMLGFLVVMREPLTALWLERGDFTSSSTGLVASLIPALAVVYFCRAFASVLVFGLLIVGRARLLLAGLAGEVALNVLFAAALLPRIGLQAVVVASATSMVLVNAALWFALLRDVQAFAPRVILNRVRPYATATVGAIAPLALTWRWIVDGMPSDGRAELLAQVLVVGVAYVAVYLAMCVAVGLLHVHTGRPLSRLALRSLE